MKALVVGGTGPTGPHIAHGLRARGYEVAILHRGSHEIDEVADFEHLHGDPHFVESVRDVLGRRGFDLVVVTYGRLRLLIGDLAFRSGRIVTVGGTAYQHQRWSRPADESAERDLSHRLVARIQETEEVLWATASANDVALTHIRYPYLYGPRQLAPREWSIIRRIRDGRRTIPVLDGGLSLESRSYAPNAAHAVLLAVDNPEVARGKVYHVADDSTPTDAERAHAIAAAMAAEIELVNYPREIGRPGDFWFVGRTLQALDAPHPPTDHILLDTSRIRDDLGYRDQVGFEETIVRTVEWYLANPLEPGGDHEGRLGDPFDYAAEDAYQRALTDFAGACGAIVFKSLPNRHAYDHPGAGAAAKS
jgi:nucleoside-diphosphate-sugar epimerase